MEVYRFVGSFVGVDSVEEEVFIGRYQGCSVPGLGEGGIVTVVLENLGIKSIVFY